MKSEQNYTLTENGALTHATTQSHVLDLFSMGATTTGSNLTELILDAFYENPKLATKVIFYISDIRQGQGRRAFFRESLKCIMNRDVNTARKLLSYIPEFGRYDYLYWFMHTPLQKDALEILKNEVVNSINTGKPSLVFKWLASKDASNAETKANAEITRKFFNVTPREYRKLLSKGRKQLEDGVVERKMSAKMWDSINYSRVSSVAMKKYRKAFISHQPTAFEGFIKKVQTGEAKINSSVLYPYDVIHTGLDSSGLDRETLVEQWKALPNYVSDGIQTGVVVDTSASMDGLPMEVAFSLGLYLSEKIEGAFKNSIISFSRTAKIFDLPSGDIFDKYKYLQRQNICENTNLQSVFELILNTAVKYKVPQKEMLNRIIILSDMEFDSATTQNTYDYYNRSPLVARTDTTNLDAIRAKYAAAGYAFPQIIFWTVDSRQKQTPATMNDKGVILVGGYSPAIMKSLLSNDPYITPYKAMLDTINSPRYSFIDEIL